MLIAAKNRQPAGHVRAEKAKRTFQRRALSHKKPMQEDCWRAPLCAAQRLHCSPSIRYNIM